MSRQEASAGQRLDERRRELLLGAPTMPLVHPVARASQRSDARSDGRATGETARLAARVVASAGPLAGRSGFSARRFDDRALVGLHADERLSMASLFKISNLLAALRREQAGDIALDDMLADPPEISSCGPRPWP